MLRQLRYLGYVKMIETTITVKRSKHGLCTEGKSWLTPTSSCVAITSLYVTAKEVPFGRRFHELADSQNIPALRAKGLHRRMLEHKGELLPS